MAVACSKMKTSEKRTLLTAIRDLMAVELQERLNRLSGPTPPDGAAQAPEPPTKHG